MRCLLFFLSISSHVLLALSSAGDRSQEFKDCVSYCNSTQCHQPQLLPLSLRLTRWTCTDNCKYTCMHQLTTKTIESGTKIVQYYGKWPFWRFAGMQEPASVAFSLLNLWAHWRGASKIRREISSANPLRSYYLWWSFASINTWVWSAIFHTRDTPTTEKLDYFSAALTILLALYFTVIRLFHLYTPPRLSLATERSSQKTATLKLWTTLCAIAFICHISYLTLLPRFDYFYNVVFNLIIGLTHNALWLVYSLPASLPLIRRFPNRPKTYRPRFVGKAAILVFFTTAATGLELFDFPPFGRMIDAHALWHLSTAPIAVYWYRFLVEDASDESWREHRN
ncbi:Per1-like protein [Dendrothele bispora CBS 962.96]|uniref:Post-GPI attachment to proteins factor 3 n=1 Tax=Dendrothele bispora (strain CBS 962.96) TaxID=1314807 RepID=A0A4S8MWS4_DENBC|nr:Per1-like protein [Dendrothele bispora CBS 962.96]